MTVLETALGLWGLQDGTATLIAARENAVYRVDHPNGPGALRLHRRGYRTDAQLTAELDWMAAVAKAGLCVPTPQPSCDGPYLRTIDGIQVDMLSWLPGVTLEQALPSLDRQDRARTFHQLGAEMAKLHLASDAWPGASACARPAWDADGLVGDAPLWGCFWDNPGLTTPEHDMFQHFRTEARQDLAARAATLDYGLIHADLVPANVMCDGPRLHLIDFDDGGFGYRLFDVATALLKHHSAPDFEMLQDALIEGYSAQRPLDVAPLGLFLALRAATYVGWNIQRAAEDGEGTRNARFIAQAAEMMRLYLNS